MNSAELLEKVKAHITEIRNRRETQNNWSALQLLTVYYPDQIVKDFSSRQLISLCDTFADHGYPSQARSALMISVFFNMIRISDSLYEERDIREERVSEIRNGWPQFYSGMHAINIDKQDTCLNLAKRISRALSEDSFLRAVFWEMMRRAKENDCLISRLANRSAKPEWVFPENALEIADNYGIV